jgi:hypothetical protein
MIYLKIYLTMENQECTDIVIITANLAATIGAPDAIGATASAASDLVAAMSGVVLAAWAARI